MTYFLFIHGTNLRHEPSKTYIKVVWYYTLDGDLTTAKTAKTSSAKEMPSIKDLSNPVIKIENIVVSAALHAEIDLYALSKNVKAVDYEPEQFPGAIFKVTEPKAVIILFKNGKMICTGTNTEANIRKVLSYAAGVISKYVISLTPKGK